MELRNCRKCSMTLPLIAFTMLRVGVYRRVCTSCRHKVDRANNPDRHQANLKRRNERHSSQRKEGINTARWVLQDSRKSDHRKGRLNDLTKVWLEAVLRLPCSYCGNSALRMTVDRIDNNLGHTKANVVPACLRCNQFRGGIPYEAWMHVVPKVREAYQMGLFGSWDGYVRKRK